MMDGQTKFLKVAELKREMYADGTTDERCAEILAEIRKLEAKPKVKRARAPKKERERFMTVLGGYVLDMHNHGHLIGTRDMDGNILDRHTGKVIGQ